MKKLMTLAVVIGSLVLFGNVGYTAEHPGEHPGKSVREHPGEHPGTQVFFSAKKIRKAIKMAIKRDQRLKGGYFLIYDRKDNVVRQLKFSKVHHRVSIIKKKKAYFACCDFKDAKNRKRVIDVDFWMKKKDKKLVVYKIKIHKVNGKARFTYKNDEIVPVK